MHRSGGRMPIALTLPGPAARWCWSLGVTTSLPSKTVCTPTIQWERTVDVYNQELAGWGREDSDRLGESWHIGTIVSGHRLFLRGDYVLVRISNGAGMYQPVFAYSSKGYRVRRFYM